MKQFIEYVIDSHIADGSEIYFDENFIGIQHDRDVTNLPGRKVYTVVKNDESADTVTLQDDDGHEYTFNQQDLARALAESSRANGFQALQYPVGYLVATSGTILKNLSIYDPRLKKI